MTLEDIQTMMISIEDRIATVTLHNPDALNAVGPRMHNELRHVFRLLEDHEGCDVIVLTGAGRAFCAGGDLDWMESMAEDPRRFLPLIGEVKHIVFSMLELSKPLVCRMNGDAVGLGATLALCCDIIIAADGARFGDPHVRVGLTAGDGAAALLPHVIGYMRAKELLLTGDLITAEEGRQMGLISRVVPLDSLDEQVSQIARKLARGAQQAIRFTKTAINAGLRMSAQQRLDMMVAFEALSILTEDHAEALRAMREGRRPNFGPTGQA